MAGKTIKDIMNMSDEEISSTIDFGSADEEEIPETTSPSEEETADSTEEVLDSGSPEGDDDDGDDEDNSDNSDDEDKDEEDEDNDSSSDDADNTEDKSDKSNESKDDSGKTKLPNKEEKPKQEDKSSKSINESENKSTTEKTVEPDYKALYEKVMKPFKANGREVKLENIDEVITLMQKGANYVKKMQAIQPNIKILRMLENHQLLDEDKVTHLIDIAKGDKNAVLKLVKDSGIDPMDIDTDKEVEYKPGNHKVSDSQISLENILEEINSNEHGQDLIIDMQHHWDDASKKAIFKEPELIRVLTAQKESGIYGQIAEQVERQKVLGHPQIASLPFIQAYKLVGEALSKQGLLKPNAAPQKEVKQQEITQKVTRELGRGPAPAKKTVTNDAKAKAASPSGKSTNKAKTEINILAMSDEDFLKQMNNRV